MPRILRPEWERRFACRIAQRGSQTTEGKRIEGKPLDKIVMAELESWPEKEADWRGFTPEEAADEAMSYWHD